MSFKTLFGSTFISVLLAIALYDLVVKGLLSKFLPNSYDDSFTGNVDHFAGNDDVVGHVLRDENGNYYVKAA